MLLVLHILKNLLKELIKSALMRINAHFGNKEENMPKEPVIWATPRVQIMRDIM